MNNLKDTYIRTYTGRKFWPLNPDPADIDIIDISHALSNICRFTGHTAYHYLVAQHSVEVSWLVGSMEALMHDAAEAYICDLARPVKRQIADYVEIECRVEEAIAKRFGLVYPWPKEVKKADDEMLLRETANYINLDTPLVTSRRLPPWQQEFSRDMFLARYYELRAQ
jgi:hypothetical protein